MFQKRVLAFFLSAVLLATVLCACGDKKPSGAPAGSDETSSSGEIVYGGEITVGIAQDLGDSLDPYRMTAAGTREVLFNVYEGLVKSSSDGSYVPAIASGYDKSADGLTYTFPLRENVKFHNGAAVTAADVLYSFQTCAATTVEPPMAAALSAVKSVEAAADGKSVVITLTEPNSDFISYVAAVYIVPATYADQATAPVGTGPFRFVSRSAQQNVVLEKFADYWGEPAYLDKVTYQIYEDATAMTNALNAGSIDLTAHQSVDRVDALVSTDYQVLEGTMNLVQALYLNHKVAPFDNEKVRQAMCYAVDVDQILALTADGHGAKLGSSIYPAFSKYFDESLVNAYPTDVEKAKKLLSEAGYPNGFEMSITVPSNYTPHMNVAEVLVEQLAQVGIKASINAVEWDTWLSETYTNRNFQSTVIGFDAVNLTAGALLNRFVSTNARNMINFNNADYDKYIAEAEAATDDAKQVALYKKAEKVLSDVAANVYIQDLADLVLMKKNLDGYKFYPIYVMDMSTIHYVK